MGQGPAEVDDGSCRIDRDAGEEGEVFAAVGVCAEVFDGRMGQQD